MVFVYNVLILFVIFSFFRYNTAPEIIIILKIEQNTAYLGR